MWAWRPWSSGPLRRKREPIQEGCAFFSFSPYASFYYREMSKAKNQKPAPTGDWPAEEIRRVGYRVVDLIAKHLSSLPKRPVFQPFPQDLANRFLDGSAGPESGASADEILDQFAAEIEPYPFGNGHSRFYGWVNSPPARMGVFAE